MNSMYLANPSFSQISFHHSMVTKLPNHCTQDIFRLLTLCIVYLWNALIYELHKHFILYDLWVIVSQSHLMGELMADHHSNPEFIRNAGCEGINEKAGLPVGGQTPVLHRTRLEVRDGYQICERENTGQGRKVTGGEGKLTGNLGKKEMLCGLVKQKRNKWIPCLGRG